MPKEQITFPKAEKHYRGSSITDPREEDAVAYTPPSLMVRWHPTGSDHTGHVQLSLEVFPDVPWSEYESADMWPDREPEPVFTEPLTRSDVNKLIRVLRRARDQAYGRDE